MLWEELLKEVLLHITPLCYLLHALLKDKCIRLNGKCKSLVLQDMCNIEMILSSVSSYDFMLQAARNYLNGSGIDKVNGNLGVNDLLNESNNAENMT